MEKTKNKYYAKIENGKVYVIAKKPKVKAEVVNDSGDNAELSAKLDNLENKVDRIIEQAKPENKEYEKIVQSLSDITNMGNGETCTIHPVNKIL